MTISFVTFNRDRQRWQYARGIPIRLRPLFGGKIHFPRHWLTEAPRANTPGAERAAISEAEPYRLRDDTIIARLEGMSLDDRDHVCAIGGVAGMPRRIAALTEIILLGEQARANAAKLDPHGMAASGQSTAGGKCIATGVEVPAVVTAGDWALYKLDQMQESAFEIADRQELARLLRVEPTGEFSFGGLLAVWVKSRGPNWRGRKDNHERTVGELKEVLGNIDYRDVRQEDHAVRFRDALELRGGTYSWQTKHLERASAMYAAAVNEGTMRGKPNPFSGISVRGMAADADDDQPDLFTAAQMKAILAKARQTRFGDQRIVKRHIEVMWLLKVMTYSGMRPNEVLQLQRGDVYVEPDTGVKVMHIRRKCAVTGKLHPEKSMKNPRLRDVYVPLHPKIEGFFDYAKAGSDDAEFIFGAFPYKDIAKKRRGWFDANFKKFLKKCQIEPKPGKKLSLYSIRLLFHRACDNSGMAKHLKDTVTSHSAQNICDKYSRGADLKRLAAAVAKVAPLAEVTIEAATISGDNQPHEIVS